MKTCPFCHVQQYPDIEIVFRNELVFYCQNETYQGALKYSGVIVPFAHRETVFDLSNKEIRETFAMLHTVKTWLHEVHQPDGYNVGWNCYEVGGQLSPLHAHMHVIPRFKEEPLAGKGIRFLLKSEKNAW